MYVILLSIIGLSLAGCDRNRSIEVRTGDTDTLVIEKDDSLLQVNKFNTIKLAENVQGVLFDDNAHVIFFKQNGTVHASNSSTSSSLNIPCISQQFNVTLNVSIPSLIILLHIIVYIVLITIIVVRKYVTPCINDMKSSRAKSPQHSSTVYHSLTSVNGCK